MQHCSHAWALTVVRPNARTWETSVGCVKSRQGQATTWNTYSQSQQSSPHRCSHASKEKALMSHSHPRTPCKHSIDMLDRAPSDFPFHATTIPDQQPGGDLPLGDYCHASAEAQVRFSANQGPALTSQGSCPFYPTIIHCSCPHTATQGQSCQVSFAQISPKRKVVIPRILLNG